MSLLFRWSALLPLALLHVLGTWLGWLTYLASAGYRQRFDANVRQAGLSAPQARAAIASAGRLVTELPWLWLRPRAELVARVSWDGADRIDAAIARGKGVLMMTPHVGCFECIPPAYADHFGPGRGPMTIMYRPSRQGWLDDIMKSARSGDGLAAAPTTTGGVRQLLKALKQGQVVGLLPDQVPPEGLGVWAPFFGRSAYTMTLAVRLAQQTGAELLMCWGERLPRGRGFVIHVESLQLPLDQPPTAAAAALNAAMERLILRRPDLYLWGYARYKQPRKED